MNQKKKRLLSQSILGFLAVLFCTSCIDRFENMDKYQSPDWLKGKIYTQLREQENLSKFTEMLALTSYAALVDRSGTYAAFVPSDTVMNAYLQTKYGTTDAQSIPLEDIERLVKYHFLQMPWTVDQLQSLSRNGWISMTDPSNNKATAFKCKSLLREPNKSYMVNSDDVIIPNGSTERIVYSNSYKYVPIFFDGYLDAMDLDGADYQFYFDRAYESGEVFYANAKVVSDEVVADNGFIYTIDRVVEPLQNAEELLESGEYDDFTQLIRNYSKFTKNEDATLSQEGAAEGAVVDDLYDLEYEGLLDFHDEINISSKYTVERNYGVMAPTDLALDNFFNEYMTGWGSNWSNVPDDIKYLFLQAHLSETPIYSTNLKQGYFTPNGDQLIINNSSMFKTKVYGTNSTFIGLNEAIVPDAFTTVSAPLFLNPSYLSLWTVYNEFNLASALKAPDTDFSLFLINSNALSNDSSLIISEHPTLDKTIISAYHRGAEHTVSLTGSEYKGVFTRMLYGQIGVQAILGSASTEFVETLDGRHIIIDNVNESVTGGQESQYGFAAVDSAITVNFAPIDLKVPPTNGKVYDTNGWLLFTNDRTYTRMEKCPKFLSILKSLNMVDATNKKVTFMDDSEKYTIFMPSDAALEAIGVDTFTTEQKREMVNFHIVKKYFVFTDGREMPGRFETYGGDYIDLDPQVDKLVILDANGNALEEIVPGGSSNLIGTRVVSSDNEYYKTSAVLHIIDTVILPY